MAWPYAVYTDPTFAATVLQAAAASAHANGTLPDIAAIANAYQYSAAAAAAAAGPSYFHGAGGGGSGDYGKFQPQHYVGPVPPSAQMSGHAPAHSLHHHMMKKPFGPFAGHLHHHHHHQHHQFATDAAAVILQATDGSATEPDSSGGHHGGHATTAAVGYDNKTAADPKSITSDNKTSSSSSSSAADATDFVGPAAASTTAAAAGTSCKCGIVDCVLTTSGGKTANIIGVGGMSTASTSPPAAVAVDHLPPHTSSSASFYASPGGGSVETTSCRDDPLQSAECSLAVHKHVYHKDYAKNKLFQPYKPDVTCAAKLNL